MFIGCCVDVFDHLVVLPLDCLIGFNLVFDIVDFACSFGRAIACATRRTVVPVHYLPAFPFMDVVALFSFLSVLFFLCVYSNDLTLTFLALNDFKSVMRGKSRCWGRAFLLLGRGTLDFCLNVFSWHGLGLTNMAIPFASRPGSFPVSASWTTGSLMLLQNFSIWVVGKCFNCFHSKDFF